MLSKQTHCAYYTLGFSRFPFRVPGASRSVWSIYFAQVGDQTLGTFPLHMNIFPPLSYPVCLLIYAPFLHPQTCYRSPPTSPLVYLFDAPVSGFTDLSPTKFATDWCHCYLFRLHANESTKKKLFCIKSICIDNQEKVLWQSSNRGTSTIFNTQHIRLDLIETRKLILVLSVRKKTGQFWIGILPEIQPLQFCNKFYIIRYLKHFSWVKSFVNNLFNSLQHSLSHIIVTESFL